MATETLKKYKQERCVVQKEFALDPTMAIVTIDGMTFKYVPVGRKFVFDFTDVLRTYADTGEVLTVEYYDSGGIMIGTDNITFESLGNISPYSQIIPLTEDIQRLADVLNRPVTSGLILPPKMILERFYLSLSLEAFQLEIAGGQDTDYSVKLDGTAQSYANPIFLQNADAGKKVEILHNTDVVWDTVIKPMDCRRQYAEVHWLSRTGIWKVATWEVVGVTDSQEDAQDIIQMKNSYDVRMGLEQSVTIRLEGLCPYDYWYYSDIVTSPEVYLVLSERDAERYYIPAYKDEYRCAVSTNKVKQRAGNGGVMSVLEIELKYRHYDAI